MADRTHLRRFFPLLLLLALALLATRPLWWGASRFYFLDDGFLQLFRLLEFDRGVQNGAVYPRWSPDSAYGYGYPFFNFYPPLSFYVAEAIHLLGLDIPDAIKATFGVIIALGLAGAYFLGVELSHTGKSVSAGILTAIGYVFFPYFLLNIYTRGALAESIAAALLPWLVWALRRTFASPSVGSLILTAVFAAGIVLGHNLIAYLAAPLLAFYTLFELARLPNTLRLKALGRVCAGVILGALLAAIYWLPMLTEYSLIAGSRNAKQLAAILQFSFLSPAQAIQFSLPYQYHEAPFPLPFLPMIFGVCGLGIAVIRWRSSKNEHAVIFFMLGALLMTVLLTDWTKGVWLGIPLLSAVQFPWRLSVIIALCIAITIGWLPQMVSATPFGTRIRTSVSGNFLSRHLDESITLVLALVLVWFGQTALAPPGIDNPRGDLTIAQLARFEVNSRNLGLGWMGEFLPLTVQALPQQLDSAPNLVDPTIQIQTFDVQQRMFTISTTQPVSISWRTLYFPGWQVTLDDQPILTYPSTPMGILTAVVPPGKHQVSLSLTDTLPRRIGTLLSLTGIVIIVGLLIAAVRRREPGLTGVLAILGTVVVFLLPTVFVAASAPPAPLQSAPVDVSPQLRLIGLRIEDAALESGTWRVSDQATQLDVQAIWQVRQAIPDQPLTWRLVDSSGQVWGQQNPSARFGTGFPTAWIPNEIVEDCYALILDSAMPSGRYLLQAAFPASPSFVSVGTLESGQRPPAPPVPVITNLTNVQVGDAIQFVGYNLPARGNPGEMLPLTLFWRAQRNLHEDLTVFTQLLNAENSIVSQRDGITQDGFFPTILWQPGELITDRRALILPNNLKPGVYRLVAGLYRYETSERIPVSNRQGERSPDDAVDLGEIKVPMNVPNTKPQHIRQISLGSEIRLLGYDLNVTRERAEMKLLWQAQANLSNDYKVFVHLVDADGNLVAQQDRTPGDGNYPTRIWDADEKISDPYELPLGNLSAGRYSIFVGMYVPETGERLIITDASGHELPERRIEIATFDWVR